MEMEEGQPRFPIEKSMEEATECYQESDLEMENDLYSTSPIKRYLEAKAMEEAKAFYQKSNVEMENDLYSTSQIKRYLESIDAEKYNEREYESLSAPLSRDDIESNLLQIAEDDALPIFTNKTTRAIGVEQRDLAPEDFQFLSSNICSRQTSSRFPSRQLKGLVASSDEYDDFESKWPLSDDSDFDDHEELMVMAKTPTVIPDVEYFQDTEYNNSEKAIIPQHGITHFIDKEVASTDSKMGKSADDEGSLSDDTGYNDHEDLMVMASTPTAVPDVEYFRDTEYNNSEMAMIPIPQHGITNSIDNEVVSTDRKMGKSTDESLSTFKRARESQSTNTSHSTEKVISTVDDNIGGPRSTRRGCFGREKSATTIARYQKLASEESTRKASMQVLNFTVFACAMNAMILQPNYAIMVSSERFQIGIFSFNSATYFIPMVGHLGIAISSLFTGAFSNSNGRKTVLVLCTFLAGMSSVLRWFSRQSYIAFCALTFITGLFSGVLPVAMAYVGDIFSSKNEKSEYFGTLVWYWVLGSSGGGLISILLDATGLFGPLWFGAASMFLSTYLILRYIVEPRDKSMIEFERKLLGDNTENDKNYSSISVWNIIAGSLLDNIGSAVLFPLCLSPLAFEHYHIGMVIDGEEPLLSLVGYKWLYVLTGLMIIPSAVVVPRIFQKVGLASACVFGNFSTVVVAIALLLIGNMPATNTSFIGFLLVLFIGYPFTVLSQLSAGPMLEAKAPADERDFIQGINASITSFAIAFAPWLFGLLADAIDTNTAIWTGIGLCLVSGFINVPLMCCSELGRPQKNTPRDYHPATHEDKGVLEKALESCDDDPELLSVINRHRELTKQPFLVVHPTSYKKDKELLDELDIKSQTVLRHRKARIDEDLIALADPYRSTEVLEMCDRSNAALDVDPVLVNEIHEEIGKWFADYLKDNGYQAHTISLLIKQMILSAFPPITKDKKITPKNLETVLLNSRRVCNQYIALKEEKHTTSSVIASRGAVGFYQ